MIKRSNLQLYLVRANFEQGQNLLLNKGHIELLILITHLVAFYQIHIKLQLNYDNSEEKLKTY